MSFWLARQEDQVRKTWVKRFDSRYWTVNFPRPMMASVVSTQPTSLRADFVFYQRSDLAGLIWDSADTTDHPLLRYDTHQDYRELQLRFHWRSAGVAPLDAVYGPTLTIEGRDEAGQPKTWYVRLWNYAAGSGDDAQITIDFDALDGGFLLPAEANRVWAGDIDRMFISVVPPDYDGTSTPLAAPAEGWVTIENIRCVGRKSTILMGDAWLPEHKLRIASGYDDSYNITPERMLRNLRALGYRKWLNHYVGMSHHFRLRWESGEGRFVVDDIGPPFNAAFLSWHRDLLARAKAADIGVILSLSYELFDAHAPEAWKQRRSDGSPALTGWTPPSTLLSPASAQAQAYLEGCASSLATLAQDAGCPVEFQIGEPWWWVGPDRAPCIYDPFTTARYTLETGQAVPPAVERVDDTLSPEQTAYFDWAGDLLAQSTAALIGAAKAAVPSTRTYLLFYSPQVLGSAAANLQRLNLPTGWASPAFDILQLEDYDFVIVDDRRAQERATAILDARLGYDRLSSQYFSGFVLDAASKNLWRSIESAAVRSTRQGFSETYFWALPQIMRDGFTFHWAEEDPVSFHDVLFPLQLGVDTTVEASFSTQIITTASGHERRNSQWSTARRRYDVGNGLRSDTDVALLLSFFQARRGPAFAFRFVDPIDSTSSLSGTPPAAQDQELGRGDGSKTRFELLKRYGPGSDARRITRPVLDTVRVAINGVESTEGWQLEEGGVISFSEPPALDAVVTAGFCFEVPVRFEEDSLQIALTGFTGGTAPSVPLIEVKEQIIA